MNLSYIRPDEWEQWRKEYPEAYADLLHVSLLGEIRSLVRERARLTKTAFGVAFYRHRIAWIDSRLADLKRCGFTIPERDSNGNT